MKRLFIAFEITDETRLVLTRLVEELLLYRHGTRRLRPVAAANLHVTVKFLGDTADAQVPALLAALTTVAGQHARVVGAQLCGLSAFPDPTRPRVIYAGMRHGEEPFVSLARDVESAVAALGFPAEERPFHVHATLARVEGAKGGGPLSDFLEKYADEPGGLIKSDSLVVFESTLRATGPMYTALERLRLGD